MLRRDNKIRRRPIGAKCTLANADRAQIRIRGKHRRVQPAHTDPADRLKAGIPRLDQIADLQIARRHLARSGADAGIGGKAEDIGIVPGQVGPRHRRAAIADDQPARGLQHAIGLIGPEPAKRRGVIRAISQVIGGQVGGVVIAAQIDEVVIRLIAIGDGEASKIAAIGDATAQAYSKQQEAIGEDAIKQIKIVELISSAIQAGRIKIVPDVLVTGGAGAGDGLMGMLTKLLPGVDLQQLLPKRPIAAPTPAPAPVKPQA